ncbi:MAG: ComEC/Rec2 family competence protein, partial [Bacteroidota bacterium]
SYFAYVSEIPSEKPKFMKCQLQITHVRLKNQVIPFQAEIIAYIKKDFLKNKILPGQFYFFNAKLSTAQQPKNPGEFNYADYLNHKHIYYSAFIQPNEFVHFKTYKPNKMHLTFFALNIKYRLLAKIHSSGLSQNASAICSALLTGYDDEIDAAVMNAFAHSGTLHVLSVSGLHTGLIYVLLNFILNLFDPQQRFKTARFVLITLILWAFALITGFSAPVLRAVLMFNFLGVAKLIKRHSPILNVNILLFSAFLLLFYNVDFIFDVGFLLSYTAMLGILVLAPSVLKKFKVKNKILNYCFESSVVSLAATISTLPITLFYFNQFPTWFVLCNLVVVPLSFLILLLTFLLVFKTIFVNLIINALINAMVLFIRFFNQGKYSYINDIHFTGADVLFLSFFILFICAFLNNKQFYSIVFSLLILITWQVYNLHDSFKSKQQKHFFVYCLKGKSSMLLKNNNLALYNAFDTTSFQYSLRKHYIGFNYALKCQRAYNLVKTEEECILLLNQPNSLPMIDKSKVTKIILANNFCIDEKLIRQLKKVNLIVADASNRLQIVSKTEYLCRKFGIAFYNIRKSGAYTMDLK